MEVEWKNIMRKITRNPRLVKIRNKFILELKGKGFFLEEIGEIFRLQKSRVQQIIEKKNGDTKKIQ